ncbi:aldo/keto reductase [Rathayibacter tritici]|uniref:Aldo/keto reductase n=1 Tax=Rathayibacter tritici TaxID=33888 RepID=A0A169C721_9MICO|nr:aldo/keto reductase family protein [Rathayibacter tritici]AND17871.1 aldo/keto reductase [Rathayibacter tritici]PPF30591.1 aldo/keto reductase [Rathayibacter tritici]PPF66710.1 aldo/keto reductase [Rathayibacter tritici]PPG09252.1 aldo/keto reductase [Rathayibacter tritici]PPI17908.1 aldo/keto reductase [Rathayibacter tritici]
MQYRHVGASGLKISEIVLGTWLTQGDRTPDDASIAIVRAALDLGISTFDTADAYADGRAEVILGQALRHVPRHSVEILTKVYLPTGAGGHNDSGLSRKHILTAIDASLTRLGTDHVDIYQAHRYDVETPLEETMQAFADIVRAGKALYVGVSEWSAPQIRAGQAVAREFGLRLIANQPQYSMLWRAIEAEVVPASQDCGIGQIVWSPLAQGVLTGKYAVDAAPPAGSRAADPLTREEIAPFLTSPIVDAIARLAPIARDLGLTTAQLALAWVLSNDAVAGAIVGASRPAQLEETVRASGVRLEEPTMNEIDAVLGTLPERRPVDLTPAERPS